MEEEANTAGGVGEAGRMLTATAGESKGSGAKYDPGDAEASGGSTSEATSGDVDTSGADGRHWAGKGKWRFLMASVKTRPASPLEWEAERGDPMLKMSIM